MKDLKNYFKQLDYVLIATVLLLAGIGILMIASATKSEPGFRQILVQSIAVGMGIVLMLIMTAIDYEIYEDLSKFLYVGSILILIFVLIFGQGKEETGANSWIRLGPVSIQPSEPA